jgi:hypothetical protein
MTAGNAAQWRVAGEPECACYVRSEANESANLLSNATGAALLANMKQTAAPKGAARVCGMVSN